MALPAGCNFDIIQNPCDKRAEDRNWANVILALQNLCNVFEGDPSDPTDNLFNNLLTKFRLSAALAKGGNATAVKLDWDGSAWVDGDAITVYDDEENGGSWQGIAGYTGWARQAEDESAHFSIVRMQRIAYFVRGTLGGSLSGGSATLTVTQYSDGVDPGASVTVHDPHGRWPDSVSGGLAQALYNFEDSRYEVVQCEQSEWIAEALATQNYGPTTSTVSITSVTFKTFSEYLPDPPVPTTARNRYGQSGNSGDIILIHKSKATGEWEIVTGGDSTGGSSSMPVHRVRLSANLQIGSNAAGQRLAFNGVAYTEVEAIRIFDAPYPITPAAPGTTRGMWSGIASMEFFARKREVQMDAGGPPEYEILWGEQYARFIMGTLTEDMGETTAQQASATVEYAWGQGDTPGTTVTVHDDHDWFHFALKGAKFFAVRNEYLDTGNPGTPYYTVEVCQQHVIYGIAQLVDDQMCADDETAQITQFAGWTPSLFNQQFPQGPVDQRPQNANNIFKLAAENGDKLYIVGDFQDPNDVKWNIVQTQHKEEFFVVGVRFNQVNKCFERKTRRGSGMFCESASAWEPFVCGRVCNNVS